MTPHICCTLSAPSQLVESILCLFLPVDTNGYLHACARLTHKTNGANLERRKLNWNNICGHKARQSPIRERCAAESISIYRSLSGRCSVAQLPAIINHKIALNSHFQENEHTNFQFRSFRFCFAHFSLHCCSHGGMGHMKWWVVRRRCTHVAMVDRFA